MPIDKGEEFNKRDIYIDYRYEGAMFRWDRASRTVYIRFDGKSEDPEPIPQSHELYNQALLYGDEITREQYEKGVDRIE